MVCAELDHMKSRSPVNISPITADKVIQHTLLSIQTINEAGWKAATPYIWRTIRFRRNNDYHSFFAPIRRLLERTASMIRRARLRRATPEARTQDLSRFFRSTGWIRAIVLDAAPTIEVDGINEVIRDIDLAHEIAVQMLGRPHYLGQGVILHLAGVCEMLGKGFWASHVKVLRRFIADSQPTKLEVWDPPKDGGGIIRTFWLNVKTIQPASSTTPSTIHNLHLGQWDELPNGDLTVWLHPEWIGSDEVPGVNPNDSLALSIGEWLHRTICDDFVWEHIPGATLAIWGWADCPCGCDRGDRPELDLKAMIKTISHYVQSSLETSRLDGLQGPEKDARIKAFFEEERLKIRWKPCAEYEESERQKQE